ncbi:hypothetical protein AVDCRST_MAG92-2297 [uncultured Coleofasciculus sp.]|uniref:Uncharacterized protein n=1 Tax=uncultured Coleofasciculus sp. TaxID=1267456 RepID=A0A6J4IR06_9CYAN|nr:hypothetical protein AVDCRST_MAG92-2297 [uncultured Coleofasciculus sp.]
MLVADRIYSNSHSYGVQYGESISIIKISNETLSD